VKRLPRITVLTPSYNQAQYIHRTIESVLEQDYPDLEYWVIDGGSTDGTLDILSSYGDRICWTSERDRGQTHAINKGIERSTGEVVAYLNSDDIYETGALAKVGRFFARHPQASWVTGKCRIIDSGGREVRRAITFYKNVWLRLGSHTALQVLDYLSQPATFWHRRVIDRVGLFDETLYYAMDYDYSLRVAQHFPLHVITAYLASFRVHPSSKSGTGFVAHFDEDLACARCHCPSRILVGLHAIHNAAIVAVYSRISGTGTNQNKRVSLTGGP
jgi:glycosyltransferase involved in cell wall biosynthesis